MIGLTRRRLLAGIAAGLAAPPALAESPATGAGERLSQTLQSGRLNGLHTLLAAQGGNLLVEYYGRGEDEIWGRPIGAIGFGPDVLHDVRSVSKSVVALVYGIALAAGKVPPPEAKLYELFPDYRDLVSPDRDRLTVHHALSMTLGLEWDELTLSYDDARNSDRMMEAAPDRLRFVLERPIASEPGLKWNYCGGATALLARLIAKGTGETLLSYSRRVLFDPLGFGPAEWTVGHDGVERADSGLRLLPRDLLKIGKLALAAGTSNGKEIIPAEWITRITNPVIAIEGTRAYGYHWSIVDLPAAGPSQSYRWVGGIGWGGQYLFVFPKLDLAVAMNCGIYHKPVSEQIAIARVVLSEVVFPSLRQAQ